MLYIDNEAGRIYSAIFHKAIPEKIQRRFENISGTIEQHFPEKEIEDYRKYLQNTGDIEALEYAARTFRKLPLLTEKFKVMVYLAETLPDSYKDFINEHTNRSIGYAMLFFSLVRTPYKLVKGLVLLSRY